MFKYLSINYIDNALLLLKLKLVKYMNYSPMDINKHLEDYTQLQNKKQTEYRKWFWLNKEDEKTYRSAEEILWEVTLNVRKVCKLDLPYEVYEIFLSIQRKLLTLELEIENIHMVDIDNLITNLIELKV